MHNLQRDTIGGATLLGFDGHTLVLDEPGLFAIDILEAASLERIEFRRLDPHRQPHVVLHDLPALRELVLPPGHPPAVVRVYAPAAREALAIDGAVAEFDAYWAAPDTAAVELALRCARADTAGWGWVRIAGSGHPVADVPGSRGLVVVTGARATEAPVLSLDGDNDYLLSDVTGLRELALGTARRAVLTNLPDLVAVSAAAPHLHLRIVNAPQLARIGGDGRMISFKRGRPGQPTLHITGGWKEASIEDGGLRALTFEAGESLDLHHCGRLSELTLPLGIQQLYIHGAYSGALPDSARIRFNEASLSTCFAQLELGDLNQVETILAIIVKACEPAQAVLALQRLRLLCDFDVAPGRIWETRRTLLANHLQRRSKTRNQAAALQRADTTWQWDFPLDLSHQGWESDLLIWRYCQTRVAAAARYARTIASADVDQAALRVLVRLAGDDHGDGALYRLATRVLAHRADDVKPVWIDEDTRRSLLRRLKRLIRHPLATEEGTQAVIGFVLNALPLKRLTETLALLRHLAPGPFRGALLSLSRKDEAWFRRQLTPSFGHPLPLTAEVNVADWRLKLVALALAPVPAQPSSALGPDAAAAAADDSDCDA